MSFPFNVRVYGILEVQNSFLLSTEKYAGKTFTKFPGGALEFGEGLRDALRREFMEELGAEIEVLDHVYTTDFFQESAFNSNHQILSVYYRVSLIGDDQLPAKIAPLEDDQEFTWVSRGELSPDYLTFPIDKYVCETFLI